MPDSTPTPLIPSTRDRRSSTAPAPIPPRAPEPPDAPPPKPKLKKLRLFAILGGLSVLALSSIVFGMMMAVAGELPSLDTEEQYRNARNSTLLAAAGTSPDDPAGEEESRIAKLTGNQNRILVGEDEISPNVKNAVIAIEDRRFYEHEGVDFRGIARALWQDIRQQSAVQGGSTITQQFVKNALEAQEDRSVLQKLREAALAYHLEREWDKQRVLTQYLNTVYFGNGAYGIESAVRTYFGGSERDFDPDARLARNVQPHEAALLAGIIASPSRYDPLQNPRAAQERRDLVLRNMLDQGMITQTEYRDALRKAIPDEEDITPPRPDSRQPYFSTWVTQQLVDRYQAGAVFAGGLRIRTTLDLELQAAAEEAAGRIAGVGPSVSIVAIENRTGEVKAMVGGTDYDETPFNLATNGHRQPGSAFKPFILVEALREGISPGRVFASHRKEFRVPNSRTERFIVNNYENQYFGSISLTAATAQSDNSVFAELGYEILGTRRVAALAQDMGIRTRISTNPAMTLGGLERGVTPLEMAFAYSTIANDGKRVCGSLASYECGPTAIESVRGSGRDEENDRRTERVFSAEVAQQAKAILQGVVQSGTGRRAQIGEFAAGKTGTTENYGDAWFVGFNRELTVAVWVGYPDELRYMETEYGGAPVAGGTYPAEIWQDLLTGWIEIRDRRLAEREARRRAREGGDPTPVLPTTPTPAPEAEGQGEEEGGREEDGGEAPAPRDPAPEPEPAPTPAPAPDPTPTPGPAPGGQGGTGGAAR